MPEHSAAVDAPSRAGIEHSAAVDALSRAGLEHSAVEFLTDPAAWWIDPFVSNVFMRRALYAGLEAVGNLLVFAFLIAPPATAVLLVRRVPRIMAAAAVIGALSTVVGLLASYHYDTAAGATMALATIVVFLVVLTTKAAVLAIGSRRGPSPAAVAGS